MWRTTAAPAPRLVYPGSTGKFHFRMYSIVWPRACNLYRSSVSNGRGGLSQVTSMGSNRFTRYHPKRRGWKIGITRPTKESLGEQSRNITDVAGPARRRGRRGTVLEACGSLSRGGNGNNEMVRVQGGDSDLRYIRYVQAFGSATRTGDCCASGTPRSFQLSVLSNNASVCTHGGPDNRLPECYFAIHPVLDSPGSGHVFVLRRSLAVECGSTAGPYEKRTSVRGDVLSRGS
jgi:hypothetical protein